MPLGFLVQTGLKVYSSFFSHAFKGLEGQDLGVLKVHRNLLTQVQDPSFLRRAVKLDLEGRDLDTHWRLTSRGEHVASVVHLFPHNLLRPEGSPPGRGYEVRSPTGEALAFSDQTGRMWKSALVLLDETGVPRVRCMKRGLGTRMVFEDVEGRALADFGRGVQRETWRLNWRRGEIEAAELEHLAECLLVALLWKG